MGEAGIKLILWIANSYYLIITSCIVGVDIEDAPVYLLFMYLIDKTS